MFFKTKQERINIAFITNTAQNSALMFALVQHTKIYFTQKINPIFYKVTNIFFFEWIFALQKNLKIEITNEIIMHEYKKRILEKRSNFFTHLFITFLAKMHFIYAYSAIRKYNISHIIIEDDLEISNKAWIIAAKNLGKNVTILQKSHKENLLILEHSATRWLSSLPQNPQFYLDLPIETEKKNVENDDIILVLLQEDSSPDVLLHSPWIRNQKHFLHIVSEIAQNFTNLKFIVFNAEMEYEDSSNVFFTKETFSEFLPLAKAVLTINAPQAIIAYEHSKSVIFTGNSPFAIDGISFLAGNIEQISNSLNSLNTNAFNFELAQKFVWYFENQHAIKITQDSKYLETIINNILTSYE